MNELILKKLVGNFICKNYMYDKVTFRRDAENTLSASIFHYYITFDIINKIINEYGGIDIFWESEKRNILDRKYKITIIENRIFTNVVYNIYPAYYNPIYTKGSV